MNYLVKVPAPLLENRGVGVVPLVVGRDLVQLAPEPHLGLFQGGDLLVEGGDRLLGLAEAGGHLALVAVDLLNPGEALGLVPVREACFDECFVGGVSASETPFEASDRSFVTGCRLFRRAKCRLKIARFFRS